MANQLLQCFQTGAVRFKMRSILRVRIAPREEWNCPFIEPFLHDSLSLPPSFTCLLLLSLSPSTGKSIAAAARPRSVWLDHFYSRLPLHPFKLLSPQLCNTSETVWWKGDSLDSRVRPGADRLQPQPQWASRYPIFPLFSSHQPDTSWQQAPSCIQKGSKEENAPLDKHIWLSITNE